MSVPRTAAGAISPPRRGLVLLLAFSYGLRVWLAAGGGQGYWDDEGRYSAARAAISDLRQGRWHDAAQELLGHAIHPLFPWFGLIPAAGEELAGVHPAAVAAYFGIFSVLVIYLVWAIARRAGAGEAEALWAAYFAACANSLFYYSRHFFPYDISLALMLTAFWLGLGPWSWRNSLLVGVLAGTGFLTYNGYWWLGGCVLILHGLLGGGGGRRLLGRIACSGAGLAAVLALLVGLSRALGNNLVGEDAQGVVLKLGDFSSGPRVIAEYLWQAEGGLLLLWLAALGYAFYGGRREARLAWYAGAAGLVTGGLVLLSDPVLFPVQGRRVREVVPFLCLGAGLGVARFLGRRGAARRRWSVLIALLAAGCALGNFLTPLRQVFPDKFRQLAAAAAAREPGYHAYRLVFAENLWGVPLDGAVPSFSAILRRPHPLQFRPYQYEGYDLDQRAALNRHDISMRLIRWPGGLDEAGSRWRGYPGPVRFVLRFPANVPGRAEPLITAGQTGQGDIFYVRYLDAGQVKFGLDHWAVRATESAPLAVDPARPHEVVVSAGFLQPPPTAGAADSAPELAPGRLRVLLDGRPVFSMEESFYPSAPRTIAFGANFIGGTVARPSFTGDILEFGPASVSALRPAPSRPGPQSPAK